MTVHVDELTSEVIVEPEAPGVPEREPSRSPSRWDEEERFRALRERLTRDRLRTAAEGFDD